MNALIDTNVILDDILSRAPNDEAARKISHLVTDEEIGGYLTANSLTDIFYVVAKVRDKDVARTVIRNLLLNFEIVSVDGQDCQRAIDSQMSDFEDALVVVCAEKAALDFIVTNDNKFLGEAVISVPTIKPTEFISRFE